MFKMPIINQGSYIKTNKQRVKLFIFALIRPFIRYLRYWLQLLKGNGFRAMYFSGTLVGTNTQIKLLFLGTGELVTTAFFDNDVKAEFLGLFKPLATKKALLKYAKADTDIIVTPYLPWSRADKSQLIVPVCLEAILQLPGSMAELLASLRSDDRRKIKQALNLNFEYETASSEADYQYFQTHMLIPFVKNRHGENAFVAPFAELFAAAHNSVLVFLKLNGQRIAGFHLIWPEANDYAYFNKIGMAEAVFADTKLMRLVNLAIYHHVCELTIQNNIPSLHLSITPPVLNNGILWFKRSWGADFFPNADLHRHKVELCSSKKALIQQHQGYLIGFDKNKLVARVNVTAEMLGDPDYVAKVRCGRFSNLSRIDLVYADGRVEAID
jgi:hypothetical protein